MKKLFIAIATLAAFTACSKMEVQYEQPAEIAISAVSMNRTKAMVSGTTFPQENFALWAYYKQLPAGTDIEAWQVADAELYPQTTYIDNKEFKPSTTTGLWSGVIPYFWPKIGSLLFAGYYPVSMKDFVSYEFSSSVNKMTVAGYTPGDYQTTGFVNTTGTNHAEDFMYFNMTPSSSDGNTVGKLNSVTSGNQVDVFFRHALSWISVVLSETAGTPEGAKITVNSITFTDVKTTGTGIVDNSVEDNEINWTTTDAKTDIVVLNSDVQLGGTAEELEKQPVVIPQEMAMNLNLVVVYTISSTDGSSFQETKTIELSTINSSWEPGKKYTYNISIGTAEILIDPIIVDWAPVGTSIPIQ